MFPDDITFVCFYDAERVLSAIVYLLQEGEGQSEMKQGSGIEKGGGYEREKKLGCHLHLLSDEMSLSDGGNRSIRLN